MRGLEWLLIFYFIFETIKTFRSFIVHKIYLSYGCSLGALGSVRLPKYSYGPEPHPLLSISPPTLTKQ